MPEPILLYDGVCGLCNRFVQFILRHDRAAIFCFASLQSSFATPILARHGSSPAGLETVYVVLHYNEPEEWILERSDAVAFVLRQVGGIWGFVGGMIAMTPRPLRDWGYRLVVRHRYRIFGRFDVCPMPTSEARARFLDQ
jgi:predicted DCC family thiol-disulfide oxidoreductase YuxK